jgi:hypothetical protein
MPNRVVTDDVVAEIDKALGVWKANPSMTIVNLTREQVEASRKTVVDLDTLIEERRRELTGLIDQRDDQAKALNELAVRVRGAIKSNFGADSPEYEQAGGTRTSERKRPAKKS